MGFWPIKETTITIIILFNHKNHYVVAKAIEILCDVMVLQL
jgi:hypothetical protein